jgi:hypothetical protein
MYKSQEIVTICRQQQITLEIKSRLSAMSEMTMELKFLKNISEFLEIDPGGQMKVYVNCIDATLFPTHASSGIRTIGIDTRMYFVRELKQGDG